MKQHQQAARRSPSGPVARGTRTVTAVAVGAALACGNGFSPAGWQQRSLGQVTMDEFMFDRPAIAVDADGRPAVAYIDVARGGDLIVKVWDGLSWNLVGGAVNFGSGSASVPALTLDSGALAIAWEEVASGSYVVRAARFDGTSWSALGTQLNAPGSQAHAPAIASGTQGLVVAYCAGNPTHAVVTRWDGSTWRDWVQTSSLNAGAVELALLPDGSPAVAWIDSVWQDGAFHPEVATRYWDASASAWAKLPSVNLQDSASASVSLAADVDGSLFLAAEDSGSAPLQPVLRAGLGASDWELLGLPDGATSSARLALLPGGSGIGITTSTGVALYTGSSWETIVTVGKQPSSFASAADGTLYVAWIGASNPKLASPVQVASFRRP